MGGVTYFQRYKNLRIGKIYFKQDNFLRISKWQLQFQDKYFQGPVNIHKILYPQNKLPFMVCVCIIMFCCLLQQTCLKYVCMIINVQKLIISDSLNMHMLHGLTISVMMTLSTVLVSLLVSLNSYTLLLIKSDGKFTNIYSRRQ